MISLYNNIPKPIFDSQTNYRTTKKLTMEIDLANEVNKRLKNLGCVSWIAGGAPRDWVLNKPVSDLDFYVYYPGVVDTASKIAFNTELMKTMCNIEGVITLDTGASYSGWVENVLSKFNRDWFIYSFIDGHKQMVQLMIAFKSFDIAEVVSSFDCSICEFYYEIDEHQIYTSKFNLQHLTNSAVMVDYKNKNTVHMQKMKTKFPELKFLAFPYQTDKIRKSEFMPIAKVRDGSY